MLTWEVFIFINNAFLLLLFSQALGAVEAMSDRYCVSFQEKVHISAENLMTCCEFCGHG